jgi:hypothetical protein
MKYLKKFKRVKSRSSMVDFKKKKLHKKMINKMQKKLTDIR